MKKKWVYFVLAAVVCGILGSVCSGVATFRGLKKDMSMCEDRIERIQNIKTYGKAFGTQNYSGNQEEERTCITTAVENMLPAVVCLECTSEVEYSSWFGKRLTEESVSRGSGVIVSASGSDVYIVTNAHVVDGAVKIEVTFVDGEKAFATVKGVKESKDIAIIAVPVVDIKMETCDNIRVASIGNSDALRLGDVVIAIGNAYGNGISATVGYISAFNREVNFSDGTSRFLTQTDTAINPGNSGGAMVNERGELIGISDAKAVSDSIEGVCFMIPFADVIDVVEGIIAKEDIPEAEQAILSITVEEVNKSTASWYGWPMGLYIVEVDPQSAEYAAGLRKGDILVEINDEKTETADAANTVLAEIRGGSEGTITVYTLVEGKYEKRVLDIVFDTKGTEE